MRGVACARVASQLYTAVSMMVILLNEHDETRIEIKKIRIYKASFLKILKYGM